MSTGGHVNGWAASLGSITGADYLSDQYDDGGRLAARQSLWRLRPGPTLQDLAVELAALEGDETVVDVGCGTGAYLSRLRSQGHRGLLLGLDLSAGMARESRGYAPTAIADVQAVPLRDGSVDVALCMHMLYHVPDLPRAVRELRRVVRPGGTLIAATNGAGHTAELDVVLATSVAEVVGTRPTPFEWSFSRFSPQVARDLLATVFPEVEVHDVGVSFPVTDVAALVDYLASLTPESVGVSRGEPWNRVLAIARDEIVEQIDDHGHFEVTTHPVVLRCR
jgi:SAM-dependent methyltransferase